MKLGATQLRHILFTRALDQMQLNNNPIRLDDLYRMVAHIYSDKNLVRTTTATFSHFVEVCGMLSIHARNKKREGFDVTDALCKALGWYFPLLAKLRVRSVEELIFTKFPRVCPYCRKAPHRDADCKQVKGTEPTLNHHEVKQRYSEGFETRPVTLNDWQAMFQDIYPRTIDDRNKSIIGLFEELGELSEAVRVFEAHPKYFLGEAADTFSYLMGIANEHALRLMQEENKEFSFEDEFLKRYPGLCPQCGSKVCACPSVPAATVGRMAKEMNIPAGIGPFVSDLSEFDVRGAAVARDVLDRLGGYHGLTESLPLDRGDANRALVLLCLKVAEGVDESQRDLAEKLRAEAYKIAASAQQAGTAKQPFDFDTLIEQIKAAWHQLPTAQRSEIKSSDDLIGDFGEMLDTRRALVIQCSPIDEDPLRVAAERRTILQALGTYSESKMTVDDLPAARVDDLVRALRTKDYEIIHFSGHADGDVLVFEQEHGNSSPVPLKAVAKLIQSFSSVKCVILNACSSLSAIEEPLADVTIGMSNTVNDDEAIAFAKGFYEAIGMGKSYREAYSDGVNRVELAGYDANQVKLLVR